MLKRPALKITAFIAAASLGFFLLTTLIILGSSLFILSSPSDSKVQKPVNELYSIFNSQPPVLGIMDDNVSGLDGRAAVLSQYFAKHKAPLAPYGEKLVEAADKYGLDWRLLPAISMQESNGGKKIPEGSYNPFGWAIHSQYSKSFSSWEEGIETVARGLKKDYIDRGLVTPCEIMTRYNPISTARDGSWCQGVEYFIWDIQNT
jgi:hypothetical protein